MSKGIVIMAFGDLCYGYAAWNLAVSLKFHSDIPILLLHDDRAFSKGRFDMSVFDHKKRIEPDYASPAITKASIYEHLIFDENLYLDVDAMAFMSVDPLFERLSSEGKNYAVHIHETYDQDSPEKLPAMFWADKSVIWDHYKLNGHKLPATQSSIQYIRKSPEAEKLFKQLNENLRNPIPLNKLRNQWGGSQPDELYLNVALAQLGMNPSIGDDAMFFANKIDKRGITEIKKSFYFLSLFGGRNFTREMYQRLYDMQMIKYCNAMGENHRFKSNYVLAKKHSDKPQQKFKVEKPIQNISSTTYAAPVILKSKEKLNLVTSWFDEKDGARRLEFLACLEKNIANDGIEKIHLFCEGTPPLLESDKLTIIPSKRITFKQAFDYSNKNISSDSIVMFANSDIFIDDQAASQIKNLDFTGNAFALSRWDIKGNQAPGFKMVASITPILFNYPGSQDSWIFKGEIPSMDNDFYFGLPRCDHRIAFEIKKHFKLFNPAKSIKTIHLHQTNVRTYSQKDELKGAGIFVQLTDDSKCRKKRILIKQPGHFGDIIICLPIAKSLGDNCIVEWECPSKYHDLFRNIDYCIPVVHQTGKYDRVIDLSFGLSRSPVDNWWKQNHTNFSSFVQAKYELAGVDLMERWKLDWTRNEKRENELFEKVVKTKEYKLVHDSGHTGKLIDVKGEVFFSPIEDYNIFDWYKVIMNASEIVCTDSSLANFIEAIPQAKAIAKTIHDGCNGGGVMKSIYNNNWKEKECA